MSKKRKKAIVIIGPTASGKTGLAVWLARKFNGEIVSADSRQVYKHMDVGTGKDLSEYRVKSKVKNQKSKWIEIPNHLIDVVGPNSEFDLAKWKIKAEKIINEIQKRDALPIVAGGTGLYAQALVDNYQLSKARPDKKLRVKLEKLSVSQVFNKLAKIDKKFAQGLNNSEKNNKQRLIRYIEARKNPILKNLANTTEFEFLVLGIKWPREILRERIYKRLIERLEKEDMVGEVGRLHKIHKVSWKRLINFGLEYKFISQYLNGQTDYYEMVEKLNVAIGQFAKRQMTWYRRWEKQGRKIHWLKNKKEAEKEVKKFLEN